MLFSVTPMLALGVLTVWDRGGSNGGGEREPVVVLPAGVDRRVLSLATDFRARGALEGHLGSATVDLDLPDRMRGSFEASTGSYYISGRNGAGQRFGLTVVLGENDAAQAVQSGRLELPNLAQVRLVLPGDGASYSHPVVFDEPLPWSDLPIGSTHLTTANGRRYDIEVERLEEAAFELVVRNDGPADPASSLDEATVRIETDRLALPWTVLRLRASGSFASDRGSFDADVTLEGAVR